MSNFGFNGGGISLPSVEGGNFDNRGDHVLKPGAGIVMRPSWSKSDPTVIRAFPCTEAGNFQPTRYSDTAYSRWFFDCTVVSSFGSPNKTWIAYDPEDRSYEIRTNPAFMVYDLANQVSNGKVRGPQDWALAIKGGQGKSAAVSKPDRAMIMRCAIYEYKGMPKQPIDGLAPHHQTVFMLLKKSAWTALVRELNVLRTDVVSVDDPNKKFESGDVVSLKDGAYFVFFEIGMNPAGYTPSKAASAMGMSGFGSKKPIGYDCIISKGYKGQPASFDDGQIQVISNKVATPIRDNLNFPTNDEQVRYIVDSMRSCPAHAGLVVHALRDRYEHAMSKDFINYGNDFLRQVGLMSVSVANPGFGYAQASPQVHQPDSAQLPSWPMSPQVQQYAQQFSQPQVPVHPVSVPAPVANYQQNTVPPVPAPSAPAQANPLAPVLEAVQQQVASEPSREELLAQIRELRSKSKS